MNITETLRRIPLIGHWLAYDEAKTAISWDTYSLAQLKGFAEFPEFPWTGSALRPSAVRLLVNEVTTHRRKSFLELGSGISTLFLAEAARRHGGSLVSVEQDEGWIEVIRGHLQAAGTEQFVRFIHVPVVPRPNDTGVGTWYDTGILSRELGGARFDLVLVDAPISIKGNRLTRMPAGGFLKDYLTEDFALFLDDIDRRGEQKILRQWARDFGWAAKNFWPRSSLAVFRDPSSKPFNIC
ncbi:MAG: class I SAM-dependent methyltransferase [Opitutales bacterium]